MKKTWILTTVFGMLIIPCNAQKSANEEKPEGKAIITIFSNLHSGFGHNNNDRGFELDRSYLGYQYSLPKQGLEFKAVMDVGQSDDVNDYHRIAYVKNALVTWKYKKLTLNGGLISTTQFKTQESFWGKRYIAKSFQDEYKFGSSADLGISLAYKFNDWIAADVIVVNGEGYKKVQVNDGLQYGGGITLTPFKGLICRAYASYNEAPEKELEDVTNLNAFIGYKNKTFLIGAEWNYQTNTKNIKDQNQNGYSAYTNIGLSKNISLFGRYDYITSKNDWNEANDGSAAILGAEFTLGKYIKLAPNVRLWTPKANDAKNSYYAYLNCSFNI